MQSLSNSFYQFLHIARIRFGRKYAYLLLICCVATYLGARGLTDEGVVSPGGDMPRYLMNGVYFYDLARDLPVTHPVQYTYQYFARYPALSLGHHPILPSLALVPFYYFFGISVSSARLATLFFFLLMTIMWFLLISRMWDENIALFSSLLLITNPFIVPFSREVMSETSTLALIITTMYFLYRYIETDQKKHIVAFLFAAALSVYAKHTAVFMFPVYLIFLLLTRGVRKLFTRDILLSGLGIILLILPLVPLTLKFSRHNVAFTQNALAFHAHFYNFLKFGLYRVLAYSWEKHFPIPVLLLAFISICMALYRKQKREVLFLFWVAIIYLLCVVTGAPSPRHVIYWIPPICLLAAATIALVDSRQWKVFLACTIFAICIYQLVAVSRKPLEYARGYEDVAEYVVANFKGDSVLYCPKVDTGFFIFFVRKHDTDRNIVVLRANKVLATSDMNKILDDRIDSPEDIYRLLHQYGVHYVVIEDKEYYSPALKMLQVELKKNSFILKKKITIESSSKKLLNTDMCIYEFTNFSAADPKAILQLNIPLMGENIRVPFSDLIHNTLF